MNRVAIVTGGSGGIGRCTAAALFRAGCTVYEFSRHEKPARGVKHITADMTKEDQVRAAVEEVVRREGRIDILVNNAGFGISGAAETTRSEDAHAQLELNLFGMDYATKAVLPVMREQRSGRIVSMSSIAGIVPIPFQLWYSVSKAAIIAYVLALQTEVRPWGITLCAIMPGDIGMTVEYAGNFVAKYELKKNSRPLVALGTSYKLVAVAAKLLPRRFSNWLIGKIYAK